MNKKIIPFSPKNGTPGCMLGKVVEVSSESQLKSIRFFLTDYGDQKSDFSFSIYSFSDRNPNNEIYVHPELRSASSGNEWIELSLVSEKVILAPGKYLIAIRWPVTPGEDGSNSITVGFQESNEEPISWMNWHGQWQKDTGPYQGNFMIEAVLEKYK